MLSTGKVVRGIQGRLQHAGNAAGIASRSGNRRAVKRSASLLLQRAASTTTATTGTSSSSTPRRAGYSTTAPAERAVVNGKAVPLAEDIVHERFLVCVEKGDAHAAMAHFAFISCEARERGAEGAAQQHDDAEGGRREAGELLTLRRRQLLVLLCEKGMVKEASELLTNAVASPAFDSRDSSTIACFMYVMCGCLSHGDVDRALLHFRQASERGIGLALPVCENLATALFIKGLQGQGTEGEAWDVLEYIRQRGMVHRPEVYERALLWALASQDLSFALRMCQHVDDEGMVLDHDVRDAVFRAVGLAIKQLPDTAVVNINVSAGAAASAATPPDVAAAAAATVGAGGREDAIGGSGGGGGGGGEWKVEGTNATVEQLWELDALLQSWVDTEMDEFGDDDEDDDDDDDDDEDDLGEGTQEFEISVEGIDEGEGGGGDLEVAADDVLDVRGDDPDTMAVEEVKSYWAEDVVDFHDDDDDDDDTRGAGGGGGEKSSAGPPQAAASTGETQEGDNGEGDGRQGWPSSAPDFAGAEFCGDLVDQMSQLHPDQHMAFKTEEADYEFPDDGGYLRGDGSAGQYRSSSSLSRRSVLADLVMPYGDPQGEGGQGLVSIPIKISVHEAGNDDDDEDD